MRVGREAKHRPPTNLHPPTPNQPVTLRASANLLRPLRPHEAVAEALDLDLGSAHTSGPQYPHLQDGGSKSHLEGRCRDESSFSTPGVGTGPGTGRGWWAPPSGGWGNHRSGAGRPVGCGQQWPRPGPGASRRGGRAAPRAPTTNPRPARPQQTPTHTCPWAAASSQARVQT